VSLAAIVAVAFVAFFPSLYGYFLSDDFNLVTLLDQERKAVDWPNTLSDFYAVFRGDLTHSYYRPMISLSAALDFTLWGPRASGFHLTNTTLHAANSLLVYAIAVVAPPFPNRLVGLAAGLLFALHPVHPEAVYWLAARTDLIVTLFTLSSFLLYLVFWRHRRPAYYLLSLLSFLAALASKETAVALPLALALLTAFPPAPAIGRTPRESTARLRWLAPYFLLLAGYFLFRKAITGFVVGQYGSPDVAVFRLSDTLTWMSHLIRSQVYPVEEQLLAAAANSLYGPAVKGLAWVLPVGSVGLALAGARSRRPWFYLGLMLAFASPLLAFASPLLLILTRFAAGASPLTFARMHYLPSAAYCLFLGSLLEKMTPLRALLGSMILAAFLALLTVNSLPWKAAGGITRDAVLRIEQAAAEEGAQRVIVAGSPDFYLGAQLFGSRSWALPVAAAPPFASIPTGVQIIHLPDERDNLAPSSGACQGAGSILLRWNSATTQLERATGAPKGCPSRPSY
jgi:hypothetical protein